ncbi:MAG: tRNA preQ1(34) S-adenosylmethionine ribosyltransferase-isomerase QueA [Clostridiales bacterium]|nr:tRNA preQ1(34) S-adenosylmethionine ribosyltransferase-isomerase QueA [Clostridiales bacterium]
MEVRDFYYELPEELIAQRPLADRASSRLLVLDKRTGKTEHRRFREITEYIRPGDCLVLNDTRVIPARLFGTKEGTGAPIEFVLLKSRSEDDVKAFLQELPERDPLNGKNYCYWEVLLRPGRRARPGAVFSFGEGLLRAEILCVAEGGNRYVRFSFDGVFEEIIDKIGIMPLPPYIKEKLEDPERYQTVYAREKGSAAAPTAGLHFTQELLEDIRKAGARITFVTLHVGLGTFRPVKEKNVEDHVMHYEYYTISQETCDAINRTRAEGGRVIAVGTTSCRVLESVADENGHMEPRSGWTGIFIYPGYRFRAIDALVTNFHLPESTLLMLVSSLAGRENILNAYREAIREKYRFFSFGDAMLIV